MNTTVKVFILSIALFAFACKAKKTAGSNTSITTKPASTGVTNTATTPSDSAKVATVIPKKSLNGIYEPGNEELTAVLPQYKDATLPVLKKGYFIYTQGACTKCHNAESIYQLNDFSWSNLIEDMALRAQLNTEEKDAVLKYVASIKATQHK